MCEASGSRTALALDVARFRLAEAERHRRAERAPLCRVAVADVIAVARGLERFRHERKAAHAWRRDLVYVTDEGTLDERTLFARMARFADEAAALDAKCGGTAGQPIATTRADEDSVFVVALPGDGGQ